jgi:hypothetical protein
VVVQEAVERERKALLLVLQEHKLTDWVTMVEVDPMVEVAEVVPGLLEIMVQIHEEEPGASVLILLLTVARQKPRPFWLRRQQVNPAEATVISLGAVVPEMKMVPMI